MLTIFGNKKAKALSEQEKLQRYVHLLELRIGNHEMLIGALENRVAFLEEQLESMGKRISQVEQYT